MFAYPDRHRVCVTPRSVLANALSRRQVDTTAALKAQSVPVRLVGVRSVYARTSDPLSWDRMADKAVPRECALVRELPKTVLERAVRKMKRTASAGVFRCLARRFATSPEVAVVSGSVAARTGVLSTEFRRQLLN